MMLDAITPVVLTYNESPNIARTLGQLRWAREVVVVDSFSTDDTVAIATTFPNVRVLTRKFDSHADQWNYAAFETGIASPWILALDADYFVPDEAVKEISAIGPNTTFDGYTASFRYCVWGDPLRGTLYPPVTVLFRRVKGHFFQDGHTHRLKLDGKAAPLSHKLLHDDRKPISHWLSAQDRYMKLEAENICAKPWDLLPLPDKVRTFPLIAPFAVFGNCYFLKGGMLDGKAGLYYALQRMLAEALLGLRIIESRIGKSRKSQSRTGD